MPASSLAPCQLRGLVLILVLCNGHNIMMRLSNKTPYRDNTPQVTLPTPQGPILFLDIRYLLHVIISSPLYAAPSSFTVISLEMNTITLSPVWKHSIYCQKCDVYSVSVYSTLSVVFSGEPTVWTPNKEEDEIAAGCLQTLKMTPVGLLDRATLHWVCKNDDWYRYTAVCNVPKHLVSPTAYTDAARGLLVTSASSPKYCPLEQRATSTSVLSCWATFVCNRHRQTYSMSHAAESTHLWFVAAACSSVGRCHNVGGSRENWAGLPIPKNNLETTVVTKIGHCNYLPECTWV